MPTLCLPLPPSSFHISGAVLGFQWIHFEWASDLLWQLCLRVLNSLTYIFQLIEWLWGKFLKSPWFGAFLFLFFTYLSGLFIVVFYIFKKKTQNQNKDLACEIQNPACLWFGHTWWVSKLKLGTVSHTQCGSYSFINTRLSEVKEGNQTHIKMVYIQYTLIQSKSVDKKEMITHR